MFKSVICILLSAVMIFSLAACGNREDEKSDGTTAEKETTTTTTTETTTEAPKKRDIDPNDKLVALTFDDGPYSPVTNRILDVLEENGAVATFFVVGNRVANYSSSVKRAQDMGCEIGSHTYNHTYLTKMSAESMADELKKTNDAVYKVTGKNISILRPPGGYKVSNVNYPEIMWSVDSMDWKHKNNSGASYNNIMNGVYDGSIILMHDLYEASADTVEKIVPELISEGYKFVTVTELFESRKVELKDGVSYSQAKRPTEESTTSTTVNIADLVE